MNALVCAAALLLIREPDEWTECVLGHQEDTTLCVCYRDNLLETKCLKKALCQASLTARGGNKAHPILKFNIDNFLICVDRK